MSNWNEIAKWAATATAVVCLHLFLGGLLTPNASGQRMAPDPIFVDLVFVEPAAPVPAPEPLPTAPEDPVEPALQEAAQLPELPAQEVPVEPSFTSPALMTLPALDDPVDLFPPVTSQLALSASERPAAKPKQKPDIQPRQQPAAKPTTEAPPSTPSRNAESKPAKPAPSAVKSAEQQPAARQAGPSRNQIARWQADVGARIARHMSRTRLSGRGGRTTVQIAVTIRANGTASARLAASTGNARNDAALASQAARMPRMPAPPTRQDHSFRLPVAVQ